MSECKLPSQNSENIAARFRSLFDGKRQSEIIAIFGWDKSLLSRIWSGKQCLNAECLTDLATAERVNLTWLLTGEGPPYQVNPPPDPQDLELGPDASYYLFDRPDGIQPPLVCIRRDLAPTAENAPLPKITVYNGHPSDLMRAVEWLIWKGKLIQIVEDNNGDVARLRAGLASNKVLINDGRGLLEQPPIIMPIPRMVVTTLVEETHNGYLAGVQSTLDAQEREWIMLRRELTPAQREALLLILRGLTRGD